jgi:ABC-2 type transport system ATP-binding protein
MAAIRCTQLTRRFKGSRRALGRAPDVTALDSFSLTVEPREILGLLGPNGAGKTTLLEILSTLLWPTAGHVTVDGLDVVDNAAGVRQRIAYSSSSSSSSGLFPRLTGRQNLRLFLALANVAARDVDDRIQAAARSAQIADALDRRVQGYSDGMRQRLVLARALSTDATVWLLDEPTRSLDPEARRALRDTIREAARARGVTVLLATHDLEEASELCDRVAFLRAGRLAGCGTPADLISLHGSIGAAYRAGTEPC